MDVALNGKKTNIKIHKCKVNETEYYEFIYDGSQTGNHFTLNELDEDKEFDCTFPPNMGEGKTT